MRLGIFGGTFDPVHHGHLILAECCREQCQLDQVWFLPAAVPPHKQTNEVTSAEHRLQMMQLAVAGHPGLVVSRMETERAGVSYTVDTLKQIGEEQSDAQLYLLMGADTLADLPNWRQPANVCQLATPVVVQRADFPAADFSVLEEFVDERRLAEIQTHLVNMPVVQFSSSDIRQKMREGRSVRYQVPRAVEMYIQTNGLYQEPGS
jgi:nicotinate-nucleotide adenylyltransferase